MSRTCTLGVDVGGANIKVANQGGYAAARAFPLWRRPERLVTVLQEMFAAAPAHDVVAATMTGELADCYASKTDGVRAILAALEQSTQARSPRSGSSDLVAAHAALWIYLTGGKFVRADQARRMPKRAAASNWHALAVFALRLLGREEGILVDIGSTTCDVVPLANGRVVAQGTTDTQRLQASELVYLGAERTPISMIVAAVPYRGSFCAIARESFATLLDAQLVTGELPENPDCCATADGTPATVSHALRRLRRCLCACDDEFAVEDAAQVAQYVLEASANSIRTAVETVAEQHAFNSPKIILSGHGEALFQRVAQGFSSIAGLHASKIRSIADATEFRAGPELARCAPALAVAVLAVEAGCSRDGVERCV